MSVRALAALATALWLGTSTGCGHYGPPTRDSAGATAIHAASAPGSGALAEDEDECADEEAQP